MEYRAAAAPRFIAERPVPIIERAAGRTSAAKVIACMPVRTWVGRFSIVNGQAQEEGPLLRSFARQRPDEEEDELYVLVEPASPPAAEYCGQLVDAVGSVFRQDILSTTGAMLRALRAAHQQLHDWNQRTLREHRVGAGVSCLAVRGRNAFLAQVGPAVGYHVGDGRVRRLEPEADAREALGSSATFEPQILRFQLSPGDLVLIASPRLDQLADEEMLRAILLRGGDEALVELFRLARGQQEFSLVLLACVVEPETEAPEVVATAAPAPALDAPAPSVTPFQAPESGEATPTLKVEVQPETTPTAALPSTLGQPKVRLKGAEAEVRYRRSTGLPAAIPRIPPLLIALVLAVVAIGALAWYIVPGALEESRDDKFNDAVSDARLALDTALVTQDPAQRREALTRAKTSLQDAEDLKAGDPTVAELSARVEEELARLNAEVELPALELVAELSERVPGPISSRGLVIGGGGAYVLDRDQQRVIAVALVGGNAEPFVLYEVGELVGTEITGPPQHIAWAEDLNALLVLDDARRLIAVTPPGQPATQLVVRDAAAWGSAEGLAHQNGNLYLLDRAGDQIWRYPPSQGGFDSEREALLTGGIDLDQVVEMAIGDAVYLVQADNSALRVDVGSSQPLSQAGIDRALVQPGSLAFLPASNRLLVADRGNARIVALSPQGVFLQQWVSPTFTDLRAIAVDEPGGLVYILVGGALYRTPLPAP